MIEQVRFSKSVKFFQNGFINRWGVRTYSDTGAPTLFLGLYNDSDVDAINNHRGIKVLWHPGSVKSMFTDVDSEGLIVIVGKGVDFDIPDRYDKRVIDVPIKDFIQIKDYSPYTPVPLGGKVYAYLGRDTKSSKTVMGYELVKYLDALLPFDFIYGYQGHSEGFVRDVYYRESFINIKPNLTGGTTTAIEMAYMGRKTISNALAPFILNYTNTDDICALITEEASRIGQMPEPLITDDFVFNDWQNLKYWT